MDSLVTLGCVTPHTPGKRLRAPIDDEEQSDEEELLGGQAKRKLVYPSDDDEGGDDDGQAEEADSEPAAGPAIPNGPNGGTQACARGSQRAQAQEFVVEEVDLPEPQPEEQRAQGCRTCGEAAFLSGVARYAICWVNSGFAANPISLRSLLLCVSLRETLKKTQPTRRRIL